LPTCRKEGAGFAGFATWLDMTPAHPDMLAVPDPASVIQLPWKPEVAWVAANCVMEGEEVAQAPRNVLRRLIAEAAERRACTSRPGWRRNSSCSPPMGDRDFR
jgi:glutamine synthetase